MATVAVQTVQLNQPLMRGWLQKKSRHMKKWRKRWVILQDSAIYTFKTDTNIISQATEIIDLHSCIYLEISSNPEPKSIPSSTTYFDLSHCFQIFCHDVIFKFNAESVESMNLWMKYIEQQLFKTYLKPKPSKSIIHKMGNNEKLWICSICAQHNSLQSQQCILCGNVIPADSDKVKIVSLSDSEQQRTEILMDNTIHIMSDDDDMDDIYEQKEIENEDNTSWQCGLCTYRNIDLLPFCEICGATKPEKKRIQRKNTHLSADQVSKDIHNDECKFNYIECPCIERVNIVLEFYQKWLLFKKSSDNHESLEVAVYQKEIYGNIAPLLRLQSSGKSQDLYGFVSKIFDNYSNVLLLNDFNHILDYHCNESQHETERVSAYLMSRLLIHKSECNVMNCLCLKRNHKSNTHHAAKRNELYFVKDVQDQAKQVVTQQILDRIHCRLIHSFELYEFRDIEDKQIRNAINFDELHLDHNRLKTIKNIMKQKKRNLHVLRNRFRIAHCKYTTQIASQPKIKDIKNDITISFGVRCFYWKFYGSNKWYIFAKYDNLKDELLNNNQQNISLIEYNDLYLKCSFLFECSKCKQLKCKEKNIENFKYYGLNKNELFKMDHIMAMLLYCNDDVLCNVFISTFTVSSDVNEFKKVHREYRNWARLMREICECFGNELSSKTGSYYHGISSQQLLFGSTIKLCKPTSCTSSLSVSLQYLSNNDDGLILEIGQNCNISSFAYYFDYKQCSIFCDFASEMESIFVGGYKSLKLKSILNIVKEENYRVYLTAIHCLQHLIIGHHSSSLLNRATIKALNNLIQNEIKKDEDDEKSEFCCVPQYIANLFHFMAEKINYKITLKMDDLNIFRTRNNKWCKFEVLVSLFPNVENIRCEKLICDESTMVQLYSFCESINLNKNNKHSNINEIIIVNAIFKIDFNDLEYMQQVKTPFHQINWNIQLSANGIRIWK